MASGWRGHRPLAVSLLELSFLPFPFGIRNLSILKPYTLPFGFLNFAPTSSPYAFPSSPLYKRWPPKAKVIKG